jgi:dTDP-4-dehydrorhamnose 3,5-epimerase
MLFNEVGVAGAFVLTPQRREDERGYFARIHCEQELAEHGLAGGITQINTGFSPRAGTLRGMHFQMAPHAEVKIMRCVRGAVYDVIVDLRRASPTFMKWYGIELRADSGQMLYAPEGTAHGYLTLADETELIYMTNKPYAAEAARGLSYADPAFNIAWPGEIRVVSQNDRAWPPFGA